MKQTLKKLLAAASLLVLLTVSPSVALAAPVPTGGVASTATAAPAPPDVSAASSSAGKGDACAALNELDSTKGCGNGAPQVGSLISSVINILSIIVGIAAVIMIIISGFKYVTSGGDSGGVASAKTTLIYALVGLAIAASAQLLVRFVLKSVG